MPLDLSRYLTIAISSRALFALEEENTLFEQQGTAAYEAYQLKHEREILKPGPGFPLVRALLRLNNLPEPERKVEVVILSRNNPCVGLRLMHSVEYYGLDITRAAFTSGTPVSRYLHSFGVALFLSRHAEDVKEALAGGTAAGLLYALPADFTAELDGIRIAFDGDAVIFSDEAERIFQEQGVEAFERHEKENADRPLPAGPFARLLKSLADLQRRNRPDCPIRLALITARNSPAHERVLKTLRAWQVRIDEMFFLGGVSKDEVLRAFQPHIFFDDRDTHCVPAARVAPTAQVPIDC